MGELCAALLREWRNRSILKYLRTNTEPRITHARPVAMISARDLSPRFPALLTAIADRFEWNSVRAVILVLALVLLLLGLYNLIAYPTA